MASKGEASSHVGAQRVLPFKQCVAWYRQNNMALGEDDRALLQRWLDDNRASEVWSAIRAHAEQYDGPIGADAPIYFIVFILTAKRAADSESKANAFVAAEIGEAKELKAEIQGKIARAAKQMPFENAAKFLEYTGKILQGCPSASIPKPRVRSDRGGSRARTYFIRDVSNCVHDITGRWMDEQVAAITEIAFDMNDTISIDSVRKARAK
jgi:hypothetical protein